MYSASVGVPLPHLKNRSEILPATLATLTCFGPAGCWWTIKAAARDLGKAESQAFRSIQDLAREGRTNEIPRHVIVCDFARIALHDLEPEDQRNLPLFNDRRVASTEFPLADFHKHIQAFAFIPGYKPGTCPLRPTVCGKRRVSQ